MPGCGRWRLRALSTNPGIVQMRPNSPVEQSGSSPTYLINETDNLALSRNPGPNTLPPYIIQEPESEDKARKTFRLFMEVIWPVFPRRSLQLSQLSQL